MAKYKIRYTVAGEVETVTYDNARVDISEQQAGVRTFQVRVYQRFGLPVGKEELVFVCSAISVTRLGV